MYVPRIRAGRCMYREKSLYLASRASFFSTTALVLKSQIEEICVSQWWSRNFWFEMSKSLERDSRNSALFFWKAAPDFWETRLMKGSYTSGGEVWLHFWETRLMKGSYTSGGEAWLHFWWCRRAPWGCHQNRQILYNLHGASNLYSCKKHGLSCTELCRCNH